MTMVSTQPDSVKTFVVDEAEEGYTILSGAVCISIPRSLFGLDMLNNLLTELSWVEQDLRLSLDVDRDPKYNQPDPVQQLNDEVTN